MVTEYKYCQDFIGIKNSPPFLKEGKSVERLMGWFSLDFEITAKPPRLRHPSFIKGGEFISRFSSH